VVSFFFARVCIQCQITLLQRPNRCVEDRLTQELQPVFGQVVVAVAVKSKSRRDKLNGLSLTLYSTKRRSSSSSFLLCAQLKQQRHIIIIGVAAKCGWCGAVYLYRLASKQDSRLKFHLLESINNNNGVTLAENDQRRACHLSYGWRWPTTNIIHRSLSLRSFANHTFIHPASTTNQNNSNLFHCRFIESMLITCH